MYYLNSLKICLQLDYIENTIQNVTVKLYSKYNSEEKEEMLTGGLGGCSGVYRLFCFFLQLFLRFLFCLTFIELHLCFSDSEPS